VQPFCSIQSNLEMLTRAVVWEFSGLDRLEVNAKHTFGLVPEFAYPEFSIAWPFALAYLDLDRFKLINDLFGHSAGDEVLQQVCKRITDVVSGSIKVGRVGGDEFTIVLPDTKMALAALVCQGIVRSIGSSPFRVGEKAFTASYLAAAVLVVYAGWRLRTLQAAALVGHQVMVAGNGLQLGDTGAIGGLVLTSGADQVVVTIKDQNGLAMRTLNLGNLDAGTHNFAWDGKTDAGVQAVNGSYGVSVAANRGTEKVTAEALELASVSNINRSTQGVTLDLGRLGLVRFSDVKQIF